MVTPEASGSDKPGSSAVRADGGAPRRGRRGRRRAAVRSRHPRSLAAAFPHLPQALLGEMAQGLEEARFRPGDVIVREGDPADRFYIIESGQVEAAQSAAEGRRARADDGGRRVLRRGRAARDEDADGDGAGGQRGAGPGPGPRPVPGAGGRVGADRARPRSGRHRPQRAGAAARRPDPAAGLDGAAAAAGEGPVGDALQPADRARPGRERAARRLRRRPLGALRARRSGRSR